MQISTSRGPLRQRGVSGAGVMGPRRSRCLVSQRHSAWRACELSWEFKPLMPHPQPAPMALRGEESDEEGVHALRPRPSPRFALALHLLDSDSRLRRSEPAKVIIQPQPLAYSLDPRRPLSPESARAPPSSLPDSAGAPGSALVAVPTSLPSRAEGRRDPMMDRRPPFAHLTPYALLLSAARALVFAAMPILHEISQDLIEQVNAQEVRSTRLDA
jgi:hypothetical protein